MHEQAIVIAELTVCFEPSFELAVSRKTIKYLDLVDQATLSGYEAVQLTLEVGSRGIPNNIMPGFIKLAKVLKCPKRELNRLLIETFIQAISELWRIWCTRNNLSPETY